MATVFVYIRYNKLKSCSNFEMLASVLIKGLFKLLLEPLYGNHQHCSHVYNYFVNSRAWFYLIFWRKGRRLCLYCQNENGDYVYIDKLILPKYIVYQHLSASIIWWDVTVMSFETNFAFDTLCPSCDKGWNVLDKCNFSEKFNSFHTLHNRRI